MYTHSVGLSLRYVPCRYVSDDYLVQPQPVLGDEWGPPVLEEEKHCNCDSCYCHGSDPIAFRSSCLAGDRSDMGPSATMLGCATGNSTINVGSFDRGSVLAVVEQYSGL